MREDEDDEVQQQESARVTAVLLKKALHVLAKAEETDALRGVIEILVYEPSLTPEVAAYLSACSRLDRRATLRVLDEICESRITSAWQAIWIASVAGDVSRRRQTQERSHVTWLLRQLRSEHPGVAAEAALALARRRLVTASDIDETLRRTVPVHRPTLIIALGALGDERAVNAAADSRLDQLRAAWAMETLG
ncbi:MAG TPA: hypothetical protein VF519_13445 [Mycobacteriales bacterium]|jgi:hypothetical protein